MSRRPRARRRRAPAPPRAAVAALGRRSTGCSSATPVTRGRLIGARRPGPRRRRWSAVAIGSAGADGDRLDAVGATSSTPSASRCSCPSSRCFRLRRPRRPRRGRHARVPVAAARSPAGASPSPPRCRRSPSSLPAGGRPARRIGGAGAPAPAPSSWPAPLAAAWPCVAYTRASSPGSACGSAGRSSGAWPTSSSGRASSPAAGDSASRLAMRGLHPLDPGRRSPTSSCDLGRHHAPCGRRRAARRGRRRRAVHRAAAPAPRRGLTVPPVETRRRRRPRPRAGRRPRDPAAGACPALGALIAEPLYVLTDTAVVGHLGTDQLAGPGGGIDHPAHALRRLHLPGLRHDRRVARLVGAGDERGAAAQAVQGLWLAARHRRRLAVAVGLLTAPAGRPARRRRARCAANALVYLRISLLGVPALLLTLAGDRLPARPPGHPHPARRSPSPRPWPTSCSRSVLDLRLRLRHRRLGAVDRRRPVGGGGRLRAGGSAGPSDEHERRAGARTGRRRASSPAVGRRPLRAHRRPAGLARRSPPPSPPGSGRSSWPPTRWLRDLELLGPGPGRRGHRRPGPGRPRAWAPATASGPGRSARG